MSTNNNNMQFVFLLILSLQFGKNYDKKNDLNKCNNEFHIFIRLIKLPVS